VVSSAVFCFLAGDYVLYMAVSSRMVSHRNGSLFRRRGSHDASDWFCHLVRDRPDPPLENVRELVEGVEHGDFIRGIAGF
jgi:hypothetical protein